MNFATFERAQVAAFAYREARHTGSIDCMRAVCFILRNRKQARWGDGTWLSLIGSHHLVSAGDSGLPFWTDEPLTGGNDRLLQLIVSGVDDIYLSQEGYDDPVRQVVCGEMQGNVLLGKAKPAPTLYYSFVDRQPRPWFLENIVRRPQEHAQVGQIGTMMFYR
jgi:hypothetical protein